MIPLNEVRTDSLVRVKNICFDKDTKNRLEELGIFELSEIRVLKNDFFHPLLLKVKGSRIAIGRDEAKKVIVE